MGIPQDAMFALIFLGGMVVGIFLMVILSTK